MSNKEGIIVITKRLKCEINEFFIWLKPNDTEHHVIQLCEWKKEEEIKYESVNVYRDDDYPLKSIDEQPVCDSGTQDCTAIANIAEKDPCYIR